MIGAHSLLVALTAVVAGGGGVPSGEGAAQPVLTPLPPRLEAPVRTPLPGGDLGARVLEPTLLRDAPGGAVVARIGSRTEFGSPRVLPVVRREGAWLGVIATERPNGELGWVRAAAVRMVVEPGRVEVSLSRRLLRVVEGGRTTLRMPVGIGGQQTPTPTGWFALTDDLRGWGPYGCCILALSGHQTRLAQGWTGGDRLAVHGSATGGASGSLGCLRASAADLHRLQRVARLGMRVHIAT